jgi:hypothetical protein
VAVMLPSVWTVRPDRDTIAIFLESPLSMCLADVLARSPAIDHNSQHVGGQHPADSITRLSASAKGIKATAQ